jgi:hypothetical protein
MSTRGDVAESVAEEVWAAVVATVGAESERLLALHGGDVEAIRAALTEAVDARLCAVLDGEPPEAVRHAVEPVLTAVAEHLASWAGTDRKMVVAGVVVPLLAGKAGLLAGVRASSSPTR